MTEGNLQNQLSGSVRIALGSLLIVAAVLKAYEIATGPIEHNGILGVRWVAIGLVQCELFFAVVLLSGLFRRSIWFASVGLFGVFAAVSLYNGISGAESCGCFGHVHVNPWWTFALDVVALVALLCVRSSWQDDQPVGMRRVRMAMAGAVFLVISGWTGYLIATSEPARLTADGIILGEGNLVVLEPEKWVGQVFPVLEYIDVGERFAAGNWTLLLYHSDCPKCQEAMPKYEHIARLQGTSGTANRTKIALIETPPHGPLPHSRSSDRLIYGRLSDDRDWFVQTPLEIQLKDGRVTHVSAELEWLQAVRGGNVPQ